MMGDKMTVLKIDEGLCSIEVALERARLMVSEMYEYFELADVEENLNRVRWEYDKFSELPGIALCFIHEALQGLKALNELNS